MHTRLAYVSDRTTAEYKYIYTYIYMQMYRVSVTHMRGHVSAQHSATYSSLVPEENSVGARGLHRLLRQGTLARQYGLVR